ncbi:MAG: hypothetical protein ABS949_14800 [Solibacillus sp.]
MGAKKQTSKELSKLRKIFKNIEPDKQKTAEKLIENAAFMAESLDELQEIIKEKGFTEEYQNGANQFGVKKCSEVEIYNTMIKNYSSVIKQLTELLPKGEQSSGDELLDFISGKNH